MEKEKEEFLTLLQKSEKTEKEKIRLIEIFLSFPEETQTELANTLTEFKSKGAL